MIIGVTMNKREKNRIIRQIESLNENKRLYHLEIPEEYREDMDVIRAERNSGVRIIGKRGYDVIEGTFFVYETFTRYKRERPQEFPCSAIPATKTMKRTFRELFLKIAIRRSLLRVRRWTPDGILL